MVTVIAYVQRQNSEGENFFALELQGGIEMVQSQNGGYYATARKTSIPSTFDEATCQSLIGQQIPGSIQKVPCDPYEYTVPGTAEVITLEHHWRYLPEEAKQTAQKENQQVVAESLVF
jgi:hypothetical protein